MRVMTTTAAAAAQQENVTMSEKQQDGHFGLCPHCWGSDGFVNVGRSHWFVCDEHKVK
jgi:hypothetical protein